ncbi:transposase [Nocardioides sp. LHG3406-4]|uniref:transposase n=1 Tax=Nocardioides sp. LHG3406-4 TaxID=2804575 RepID=UPI003CF1DB87
MGRRSQYPEEFRLRAAQLVIDSHRSIRDVANELGINPETLRNWVNAAKRQQAARPAGLSCDERMELARLRRKVAELEPEREILKRAAVFFAKETAGGRGQVCAFIAAEKTIYGVRRLCRVFSISPTTFFAWARRGGGPTPAELDEPMRSTPFTARGSSTAAPTAPVG